MNLRGVLTYVLTNDKRSLDFLNNKILLTIFDLIKSDDNRTVARFISAISTSLNTMIETFEVEKLWWISTMIPC